MLLHVVSAARLVTSGVGLTVTVIVSFWLGHPPATEVAVIIYLTVPAVELPGLVNGWLMLAPVPADAPVIPPVIGPTVHAKVLGVVAVRLMLAPDPLHVFVVGRLVITGVGNTVTVAMILNGDPTQPLAETGVTIYSTVPEDVVLGFVNTWLITLPEPAVAPVIPPVTVPIVHENVEAVLADNGIFGLPPLQILVAGGVVITGFGLTVTVILIGVPGQPPVVDVGVTMY
jgi:hypothetical protein